MTAGEKGERVSGATATEKGERVGAAGGVAEDSTGAELFTVGGGNGSSAGKGGDGVAAGVGIDASAGSYREMGKNVQSIVPRVKEKFWK